MLWRQELGRSERGRMSLQVQEAEPGLAGEEPFAGVFSSEVEIRHGPLWTPLLPQPGAQEAGNVPGNPVCPWAQQDPIHPQGAISSPPSLLTGPWPGRKDSLTL